MPDYLPRRAEDFIPTSIQRRVVRKAEVQVQLDVYLHGLQASRRSLCDQIDAIALSDAVTTSLEEELRLIDHGRRLAGGDPAKLAILASKAELLTNLDNRRLARRFQQ
jgi:hypothetical protein